MGREKPLTWKDFFAYQRDVEAPIMATYRHKLSALEARVEQLESRPILKWCGTHHENAPYPEAGIVTKGGSLWIATAATSTTPGAPGGAWRLIVKRGAA